MVNLFLYNKQKRIGKTYRDEYVYMSMPPQQILYLHDNKFNNKFIKKKKKKKRDQKKKYHI